MTQDSSPRDQLREIWDTKMSDGDRSTIIANLDKALGGEDVASLTSIGSPCDLFWGQVEALGWAVRKPELVEALPPGMFVGYAFTEGGAELMQKHFQSNAQQGEG